MVPVRPMLPQAARSSKKIEQPSALRNKIIIITVDHRVKRDEANGRGGGVACGPRFINGIEPL